MSGTDEGRWLVIDFWGEKGRRRGEGGGFFGMSHFLRDAVEEVRVLLHLVGGRNEKRE